MTQEEKSESVEIVLERARELLAAEVKRSSYQSVADRVGVSKPTLYGFLKGASTPKGDRRRKILKYAKRRGQERSGSVPRETKKTAAATAAAGHPAGLTSAGLAALWSVQSMQHHLGTMLSQILQGDVDRWTEHLTSEQAEVVVSEQLLHRAMEDAGASQTHHSANGRRAAKDEIEQPPDGSERRRRA